MSTEERIRALQREYADKHGEVTADFLLSMFGIQNAIRETLGSLSAAGLSDLARGYADVLSDHLGTAVAAAGMMKGVKPGDEMEAFITDAIQHRDRLQAILDSEGLPPTVADVVEVATTPTES